MRIIIDIPKDTYEHAIEGSEDSNDEMIAIDAIRNSNPIDTTNELHNTIYGMISDDYKERFKAEYNQLNIRIYKLNDIIVKAKDNSLEFKLSCKVEQLEAQLGAMLDYNGILRVRAAIEGINLD